MKICSKCRRVIKKTIVNNIVVFDCICGNKETALPEDVLIGGTNDISHDIPTNRFYEYSSLDPPVQKVLKMCVKCGRNYMSQVRMGDEIIMYTCKCGHITE